MSQHPVKTATLIKSTVLLQITALIKTTALIMSVIVGVMLTRAACADLAVVVHPNNPITALSKDEVRQIFMGRMRLFPSTQKNIDPVDQNTSLPAFEKFYRLVANLTPSALQRLRAMYLFSGKGLLPKILPDEKAVIAFVASHPDAIGYIRKEDIDAQVKAVLFIPE